MIFQKRFCRSRSKSFSPYFRLDTDLDYKIVRIRMTFRMCSYYKETNDDLAVFPGKYQILCGNSSLDKDLQALPFEVKE